MTDTDPTLEQWHQGERRRAAVIGVLVGAVLLLALVVGALGLALADNARNDEARACAAANVSRGEIRTSIVEAIVVLFDELADDPPSFAPTIAKVQARLDETLPDREC